MASIGSLVADMRLQSAAFQRDMRKSAEAVRSNTAQMRKHMRSLDMAARRVQRQFKAVRAGAAALAGALALRQFTTFTKQSLDMADSIAKVADSIGLSTKSLQEWRVTASLAGLEQGKFDSALQAFAKRVGEARQETGALFTFLQKYDAELLRNIQGTRDAEEALGLFLTTLADTSNTLDRAALSGAAFGRGAGAQMVILTRDGVAAMNRMRKEASALGLVLGEDLARAAEAVNDRMFLFKRAFDVGFATGIIKEFSDAFDVTKDSITATKEAAQNFGRLVGAAMITVVDAAALIGRNLREIVTVLAALAAAKAATLFLTMSSAILGFATALRGAAAAGIAFDFIMTKSVIGAVAKLIAVAAVAAGTWASFGGELKAALASLDGQETIWQTTSDGIDRTTQSSLGLANALSLIAAENERLHSFGQSVEEGTRAPLERMRLDVEKFRQAQAAGARDAQTFSRAQTMAAASTANQYGQLASTVGSALGTMFEDSKGVSVAMALINTFQGITAALAQYGATPIGLAFAAATAAMGAAQIAKINSTSKSGSGSSSTAFSGGGAAASEAPAALGISRSLSVTLKGSNFSAEQVEDLLSQVTELHNDGAENTVFVSQG